jgi:hypothetical protein
MRVVGTLLALLLLAGAALSHASGSGIRGRVTAGPTCPVERYPPDPQCAPRGFVARVHVRRRSDRHLVASIKTRGDGRFTIALRPGRYLVAARPATAGSLPRCPASKPVTVTSGHFARIAVACDSGIR